ncbi:uncharacterized protein [Argopecten irradians]|uniref:uncharacterized protein isoform X1 n=1 Tax=Argopecten irradians TaxID=31199 RepID=UPI00371BAA79
MRYCLSYKILIMAAKTTRRNFLIFTIIIAACFIVLFHRRHVVSTIQASMAQVLRRDVFFPSTDQNPIPETNTLQTLDLKNVSTLYFRYVNSLQVFCPVKKVYGGVKFGWYTCDTVRNGNPCVAYMIA